MEFLYLNEDQKNAVFGLCLIWNPIPTVSATSSSKEKISIASGEMYGRGYYEGPRVAAGSVPYQENDFIFSVAGEELGFIGCVVLLGLLLLLMLRCVMNALSAKDDLGKFLCFGFFAIAGGSDCSST